MTIYQEYAKAKSQIILLTMQLKELEPKIVEEIKKLSTPMKTDLGTFTKVTSIKYSFPQEIVEKQKEFKKEIEKIELEYKPRIEEVQAKIKAVEQENIEAGIAEKQEIIGLRFTPVKIK